jgi:hypothetical protein
MLHPAVKVYILIPHELHLSWAYISDEKVCIFVNNYVKYSSRIHTLRQQQQQLTVGADLSEAMSDSGAVEDHSLPPRIF